MDKTHRNQCRSCRLTRCLEAGMNKEGICLYFIWQKERVRESLESCFVFFSPTAFSILERIFIHLRVC